MSFETVRAKRRECARKLADEVFCYRITFYEALKRAHARGFVLGRDFENPRRKKKEKP